MRTFFTEPERERLIAVYTSTWSDILAVFPDENLEHLVAGHRQDFELGLNRLDVSIACAKRAKELADHRDSGLEVLEQWARVPRVDFDAAEEQLLSELGLDSQKPLDTVHAAAIAKTELVYDLVALMDRFPFLFLRDQLSNVLVADADSIQSFSRQYRFLQQLTEQDVARGNIDYQRLRDIHRVHTPFTPTLLTLLDMEGVELKDGHSFAPLINRYFRGRRKFDFKGIVEQVSDSTHAALASVDPRLYHVPTVGRDLRNVLTMVLMTPGVAERATPVICERARSEPYIGLVAFLNQQVLMNIGVMLKSRELIAAIDPKVVLYPVPAVQSVLEAQARRAHLPISQSSLREAAQELTSSAFLVRYRQMRNEDGYVDLRTPAARTPGLLIIDPLECASAYAPITGLYFRHIMEDLERIVREGPHKVPAGKKFFHRHRDFYAAFKKDPRAIDIGLMVEISEEVAKLTQDKTFATFVRTTLEGVNRASSKMREGVVNAGMMHYLSSRMPGKVFVEEVNGLDIKDADILLGYAMNNCLKVVDMIRYHCNPNARMYCLWLDGMRVGMSYDVGVRANETVDQLIDSIELNDKFLVRMRKHAELPDFELTRRVVRSYLLARLQHSEEGIYILPESNNFHVRDAMRSFIDEMDGERVMSYRGTNISTDTRFDQIPYWVPKASLIGKVEVRIEGNDPGEGPIGALTRDASAVVREQVQRLDPNNAYTWANREA